MFKPFDDFPSRPSFGLGSFARPCRFDPLAGIGPAPMPFPRFEPIGIRSTPTQSPWLNVESLPSGLNSSPTRHLWEIRTSPLSIRPKFGGLRSW